MVSLSSLAQVAKNQVVMVNAKANSSGSITLTWPQENYTGTFTIYRRNSQDLEDWGSQPIGNVAGNVNTFTDENVSEGNAYEYLVVKSTGSTTEALGYIFAGNKWVEPTKFNAIILVVDSNYIAPLETEIAQLQQNLISEGWKVYAIKAGRSETPAVVKQRILNAYNQASIKPNTVFLLGHIPVPYSGFYSSTGHAPPPDGHVEGSGDHTGAWPADVYYGIIENVFTDANVTITTGAQTRHHNIPGDGKFDQTKLPAAATMAVGRVDMFDMPAFGKSDTILTKDYLARNNNWRNGQWKATERALIDNNFGNLNLASTGYANFAALVGNDSVFDNRDYFTAQKNGSYLFSYGCGAGGYTSCSGIGNTNNFVNDSFENVFTILAGSFFGDWDIRNNFLRAPLASKSLASFWGGIPKWYIHHMALGLPIGLGTRVTQNNTSFYFSGNFNSSANSMHIALMGDPTLRMRNLPAVAQLNAVSMDKKVYLNWTALPNNAAYAIYRVDTVNNTYLRVNSTPITDTFFVDESNYNTGSYVYAVKAIALENTASGSYWNVGGAAYANVNHINSVGSKIGQNMALSVYPNPAKQFVNLQTLQPLNSNGTINIYDISGKLISSAVWPAGSNHVQIDCPAQPGYYLVSVQTNNGVGNVKLVVID